MKIYNKNLPQAIREELQMLEQRYFTFDTPIPFKEGLILYPVKIRDYEDFMHAVTCLTLNKNSEESGLTMSHLDYLYTQTQDAKLGGLWKMLFSRLCEIVFHAKAGVYCPKCGAQYTYAEFSDMLRATGENTICPECGDNSFAETILFRKETKGKHYRLEIGGVTIDRKEFDRIRQIIVYQNLPDYQDDSWVHEEVKADEAERRRLASSRHGKVSASLEKKIVCVSAKSNYKIEELYDLSIRKFLMLLTAIDDAMTYETNRIGLMSGALSSKKFELEHWIYKPDRSMYGAAVSAEAYTGKIASSNGG